MTVILAPKDTDNYPNIGIAHTLIAITSEKPRVAIGAHLILARVGLITRPAINQSEIRPAPVATLVITSIPTELGVSSYTRSPKIGVTTASRTP